MANIANEYLTIDYVIETMWEFYLHTYLFSLIRLLTQGGEMYFNLILSDFERKSNYFLSYQCS